MRKIVWVLLALAATISVAAAENHYHPRAKLVHASHHSGEYAAHGGFGWSHGSIEYFDADSDDDPCDPDIVQVSNKPLVNIAANVLLQVAAAEVCGGDQSDGGAPASMQAARCVHRMGVPDATSELDQHFMFFGDWQAAHPRTGAPVVPLETPPSVGGPRGSEIDGSSSETEPPGFWDVRVIESDDDTQNDQAQLVWCQTAEK